jgi:hypothetical protein
VMRLEFLMDVRILAKLFWGVMLSNLVKRCQSFEELGACLFLQSMVKIEDYSSLVPTNM